MDRRPDPAPVSRRRRTSLHVEAAQWVRGLVRMATSVDSPGRPAGDELLSEIMGRLTQTGQYLEEIAHNDAERIALVRRWGRQAAFLLGLHVRIFTTDPVRLRDGTKVVAVLITKQDADIVSRLERQNAPAAADLDASDTA